MTIPVTGPVSVRSIRSEVGASGAFTLGQSETAYKLAGKTSGQLSVGELRGSTRIAANENAVNLHNKVGAPSGAYSWRFLIEAGVTYGSTAPGTAAMSLGEFPVGSTVIVDNYGTIQGAGGVAGVGGSGGAGGNAINAMTAAAYTKTINNYGIVRGGGGGGGQAGAGGAGGTGGSGVYYTTSQEGPNFSDGFGTIGDYYVYRNQSNDQREFRWNGTLIGTTTASSINSGGYTYYIGAYVDTIEVGGSKSSSGTFYDRYYIYRQWQVANFTSGGPGGGGGAGGAGGRGQGHDGAAVAGIAGAAGAAGVGGGTNAGAGGQGGTGGTGGLGGAWGVAGGAGPTGATGATGNAGNNGAGTAGAAGTAGYAGGAAGYYLYRNGMTVTFNNTGTVNGQNG
jgi:hypothetical protein